MSENRLYYGSKKPEDSESMEAVIREAGLAYNAVDVSEYSDTELDEAYQRNAVTPSVRRGYRVKHIFGTNKYPGSRFGKEEPALVVLEGGTPRDVYPHEEGGKMVTIKDYLTKLRRSGKGGAELARRMDALRAEIGVVGVTSSDLIEEGRRR